MGYRQAAQLNLNVGPYACGIYVGPHRTEHCTWCQVCRWNATHVTKDCAHINRLARE